MSSSCPELHMPSVLAWPLAAWLWRVLRFFWAFRWFHLRSLRFPPSFLHMFLRRNGSFPLILPEKRTPFTFFVNLDVSSPEEDFLWLPME